MPEKYALGMDFGTQSGRAVLVRLQDGEEVAVSVCSYQHGVMDRFLPSGKALPSNFALQHPMDYLQVLEYNISEILRMAAVPVHQVVAVGIATTSSTIMPVFEDGTPLCFAAEFADDPHSWVKLWKHHGAHQEASELDEFLQTTAPILAKQFGASSSERMLPKILEVKRRSPQIYERAFTFVELSDWLIWQLTGTLQRSAPVAGYKAMWQAKKGYLDLESLKSISSDYADIIHRKLPGPVIGLGYAGNILPHMAEKFGLHPETAVATGHIDAHAALLGCGVTQPGTLVMVMGTSTCHLLLDEKLELVEGMSGAVQNGIIGGFYAYESGQSSVGDQFHWFVTQSVPSGYEETAKQQNLNVYEYLEKLARELSLGRTGLLALDWWNGNRSVLNDSTLSGLLIGLTAQTKPEEIYLALLESTAFGARRIVESFEEAGLGVEKLCACGGLPRRNELLVQVYANVMKRPIEVAQSDYTSALGMAMWAGVAAGSKRGGYDNIEHAVKAMAPRAGTTYCPDPQVSDVYDLLYEEYKTLYDYFGRGGNGVMRLLGALAGG